MPCCCPQVITSTINVTNKKEEGHDVEQLDGKLGSKWFNSGLTPVSSSCSLGMKGAISESSLTVTTQELLVLSVATGMNSFKIERVN